MLATRSLTEEQVTAGMMVTLPSETSKGLSKTEIDEVKLLVHLSKEAGDTAGKAMMACAEHLSAVKKIVKKKGWTALCDSGALGMGSKQAQMLALCQERKAECTLVPYKPLAPAGLFFDSGRLKVQVLHIPAKLAFYAGARALQRCCATFRESNPSLRGP